MAGSVMRAAMFNGAGKPITIERLADPLPNGNRIAVVGVDLELLELHVAAANRQMFERKRDRRRRTCDIIVVVMPSEDV